MTYGFMKQPAEGFLGVPYRIGFQLPARRAVYTPQRRVPVAASATRAPAPDLVRLVAEVSARAGLPRAFVFSLVTQESNWNPRAVNRATNDHGLFQLNAQHFGKPGFPRDAAAALDPVANARGALVLLAEARQRWGGDLGKIAADYNGGPRAARSGSNWGSYVVPVLKRAAAYARAGI